MHSIPVAGQAFAKKPVRTELVEVPEHPEPERFCFL